MPGPPLTFQSRVGTTFTDEKVDGSSVAVILIDIWDNHWCKGMATRGLVLAKKVNSLLPTMRNSGIRIIHSPSSCRPYYTNPEHTSDLHLDYKRYMDFLNSKDFGKPTKDFPDDGAFGLWSHGWNGGAPPGFLYPLKQDGCETGQTNKTQNWTKETDIINIIGADVVAFEDESWRILNWLAERRLNHLVYAGAATNECVIHTRNTSLYWMMRLYEKYKSELPSDFNLKFYLARDLTDSMYVPPSKTNTFPFPCHDDGTVDTVNWIELNLGVPSILSSDLCVVTK